MLTVKAKGVAGLKSKLKQHQVRVKKAIADELSGIAKTVFTDLVKGSPQWSGNLASNWYIEIDGNAASYRPIPTYSPDNWHKQTPYVMGDDPAVSNTLARELPKLTNVKFTSSISLANYAPYATSVEEGVSSSGKPIRSENLLYGQVAMVGFAVAKYKITANKVKYI
jgi:hypothetical protein